MAIRTIMGVDLEAEAAAAVAAAAAVPGLYAVPLRREELASAEAATATGAT
jgi:hypothetical protein